MIGNEELAQEALKYLNLAQKFENEKNLEKAVENYELAASYLKNSGFMMDKISDIFSRIEELKDFAKQEMMYNQASAKNQLEQLQDQAFSLLDGAQKLEIDGYLEDAIEQYQAERMCFIPQINRYQSCISKLDRTGFWKRLKFLFTGITIEEESRPEG